MRARFAAALSFAVMIFLSACGALPPTLTGAESYTASVIPAKAKVSSNGQVILIRGGLNVFSTGMDALAAKMRAKGIDARSVGHSDWKNTAAEIRARYVKSKGPIVLVGHSWGALADILIAGELAKTNTPVALMVLFDTTDSVKVSANVRRVINISSSTSIGLGLTVTGEPGFAGKIDQVNARKFDHLDVDEAAPLHDMVIAEVLKLIRPSRVSSR